MSDEPEVEVAGTPEEPVVPAPVEVTVPPLADPSSSGTPSTSGPVAVSDPIVIPATGAVVPENPTSAELSASTASTTGIPASAETVPPIGTTDVPVAGVTPIPPEPVAPPPPSPVGDGVAAIDAADDQARADQAQREAAAFALSTNGVPPPSVLPPPLAGVADVPAVDKTPITGNTLWVCVTEEGPRTTIGGVACPIFMVQAIPPQGQLITCPTCGNTSVRQATDAEQQLPQTTTSAKVAS
jgi:hypothetical protein